MERTTETRLENRGYFDAREAADRYSRASELQPPEEVLRELLRPMLAHGRMLDVGVGGGRTTLHFAPLTRSYVGIDYAEEMIAACHRRFSRRGWSFEVADARQLPFDGGSFDVALFAYNGIDYVGHADRLRILGELRRVLRAGGQLALSSHNLLAAAQLFYGDGGALDWLARLGYRRQNPPLDALFGRDHALLRDGSGRRRLLTYYVHPLEQLRQLAHAGFAAPRLFALDDGRELASEVEIRGCRDPWIYYLATRV